MRLCFFIVVSIFIFYSCSNETKENKTVKVSTPQDLEKEIITHLDMYRSKGIINKTEFLIISNYFLVANQNGPDSNWIKDLFINNNVSPESFKADSEKISIPENTREVLVSVYFKVNNVQSSPESETSEYK